jgi:hypothetical protein
VTAGVPVVDWPQVAGRIQRRILRPPQVNPHVVLLAQSGSGKDHTIRHGILPVLPPFARVVVLVTKPVVDMARPDPTWDGWGNLLPGPGALRPGFGRGPDHTPRYVIPLAPGTTTPDQAGQLMGQLAAEGELVLIVGDAARLTEPRNRGGLGQESALSKMMTEGRQLGLSVIVCANSASWAAAGVKDQAAAVLIGRAGGKARDDFADIAGLEARTPARAALASIAPRSWLYTDHADGELAACLSTPPAAA